MKKIKSEDILILRQETGLGLLDCKKILKEKYDLEEKNYIISKIADFTFSNDEEINLNLKEILNYLLRKS